jgi:peptidoglycan/LPS O-acetylase OafA/YrhL
MLQGGYLAVGIFFVMSGYVVSIKPLKLSREGRVEDARKVIASSAFRRIVRLGLPGVFATVVSWLMDRMGAFDISRSMPGWCWLHMFTTPEWTFSESVHQLARACVLFLRSVR